MFSRKPKIVILKPRIVVDKPRIMNYKSVIYNLNHGSNFIYLGLPNYCALACHTHVQVNDCPWTYHQ